MEDLSADAAIRQHSLIKALQSVKKTPGYVEWNIEESIDLFWGIASSDETQINRCIASLLLACLFDRIKDLKVRTEISKTILKLFFQFFPVNLKKTLENNPDYFTQASFKSSKRLACRLMMISTLAHLLQCRDMQHDVLIDYHDTLLLSLLDKSSIYSFKKVAFEALNETYSLNFRDRIIRRFREKVLALNEHLTTTPSDDAARLKQEISKFFNKWSLKNDVSKGKNALPHKNLLDITNEISNIVPMVLLTSSDELYPVHQNNLVKFESNSLLTFPFRFPFERLVTIKNSSQKRANVQITTMPTDIFITTQGHFDIGPEETVTCTVYFNPTQSTKYLSSEIYGTMRLLATEDGFILDTMPLKAYQMPAVKVFPNHLIMRSVQIGTRKVVHFSVSNLLSCDCPCLANILPGPNSSDFQISNSHFILQGNDTKQVTITFEPKSDLQNIDLELVVLAAGYQIAKVHVSASSCKSFACYDETISMPAMDINDLPNSKRILTENFSFDCDIPYFIQSTSHDLELANFLAQANSNILPKNSKSKLPIEFTPQIRGLRNEKVKVVTSLGQTQLSLSSFVGPVVHIPFFSDLIFTPSFVDQESFCSFPLVNLYGQGLELSILVPRTSSFVLEELQIRPATLNVKESGKFKEYTLKFTTRYSVELNVKFRSANPGLHRTEVILKPKNIKGYTEKVIYLNAFCYGDEQLKDQWTEFHQVLEDPSSAQNQNVKFNPFKPLSDDSSLTPRSNCFELEPALLTVMNDWHQDISQFVTLTNITSQTVNYELVISKPFMTNIPLKGILEGTSAVDIHVFLDLDWIKSHCMGSFSQDQQDFRKQFTFSGCLSVLDSNSERSVLCCSNLVGTLYDIICLEASESLDELKFPHLQPMESAERTIFVRNKVPFDIVVNLELDSPSEESKSFFSTDWSKSVLKPFECKPFTVSFKGSKAIDLFCHLNIIYEDPIRHVLNGQLLKDRRMVTLSSLSLHGMIGTSNLTFSSESIDFGNVLLGHSVELPFVVSNDGGCSSNVIMTSYNNSIFITPSNFYLKANESKAISVIYSPKMKEIIGTYMDVVTDSSCQQIPVIAQCGDQKFIFRLAELGKDEFSIIDPEQSFDVGFLDSSHPKPWVVFMHNQSDFDYSLQTNVNICDLNGQNNSSNLMQCRIIEDKGRFLYDKARIEEWVESNKGNKMFIKKRARRESIVDVETSKQAESTVHFPKKSVIPFLIHFNPNSKASFELQLQFNVGSRNGIFIPEFICIQGKIQPPIHFIQKSLDFGTCRINSKKNLLLTIENEAVTPLSFELRLVSFILRSVNDHQQHETSNPSFSFFPKNGHLLSNDKMQISVTFNPKIQQCEYLATLGVYTENGVLGSQIEIKGLGASSQIFVNVRKLEFGVTRVGSRKEMMIQIENKGVLSTPLFIESTNLQFSAQPEQIQLEGRKKILAQVSFKPSESGARHAQLLIFSSSSSQFESKSRRSEVQTIELIGEGSFPEIHVHTKSIDFGTALFSTENARFISIENKGSADAVLSCSCHHSGVKLVNNPVTNDFSEDIIIPANSTRDIKVIYTPRVVEKLKTKLFIKSNDHRADYQMVSVSGIVGIPKITIDRPDIWDNFVFGVCKTFTKTERNFTIKNEGNIPLNFVFSVDHLKTVYADDQHQDMKAANADSNVVMVYPFRGHLKVGESVEVKVVFCPTVLAEYWFNLTLNYEFVKITTKIVGAGGKPFIRFENPLKYVDFGTCRKGRSSTKAFAISNTGNMAESYFIKCKRDPIPDKPEIDVTGMTEVEYLEYFGFKIPKMSGFCEANSRLEIGVEYRPIHDGLVKVSIEFTVGEESINLEIFGVGALSQLNLLSEDGKILTGSEIYGELNDRLTMPSIDFGVHPIGIEHQRTWILQNQGPFYCDFFVESLSLMEFNVHPMKGTLPPNSSIPLTVKFEPSQDINYKYRLKIFWDEKPLMLDILASGGKGKLEIFSTKNSNGKPTTPTPQKQILGANTQMQNDLLRNGIDFGIVEFNTYMIESFGIINSGQIDVKVSLKVDSDDFNIHLCPMETEQSTIMDEFFVNQEKLILPPGKNKKVFVKFVPKSVSAVSTFLHIRSEAYFHQQDKSDMKIAFRGSGGNFSLHHKGDLTFDNIATFFTYRKYLQLVNTGSIASKINLHWSISNSSIITESDPQSTILLHETYSQEDPRGGWKKWVPSQFLQNGSPGLKKWTLIKLIVVKRYLLDYLRNLLKSGQFTARKESRRASILSNDPSKAAPKKTMADNLNIETFLKIRTMFSDIMANSKISSQQAPKDLPMISVNPSTLHLPSYSEMTVEVSLNMPFEEPLLGTLVLKSPIPNKKPYEIPFQANSKHVSILCEDLPELNFGRQAIGEEEVVIKKFRNQGHRDIVFSIVNDNHSLKVTPMKGLLKVGQIARVVFTFKPTDETVQNSDVIFQPDCSQPIIIKFFGAGGFIKCSLSKYRRFDFGRCMIGKDTLSYLPIVNEGSCVLNIKKFEITDDAGAFSKNEGWPADRITLQPGASFKLPIVFCPKEETTKIGRLNIQTSSEKWDIDLHGVGREAVLIITNTSIDFTDCLIGNAYEQTLIIKNVGDVNYPVSFKMDKEEADIEFIPNSLVMQPFSEGHVIVQYTPSKEHKKNLHLTVTSPYSTNKVPMTLHSGIAELEFARRVLDFGLFEMTSDPELILEIFNSGSIKTSFQITDRMKPSRFVVEPLKGMINSKERVFVNVKHVHHMISSFEDHLTITTDLLDKRYTIMLKGQCEESLVIPDEFANLNMGICPVLDTTTKTVSIKNYGRFPITYEVKATYPMKVTPTSGVIEGEGVGSVTVLWTPSGAYELRSQLVFKTNIGVFNTSVRGRSNFPELVVEKDKIDFGVCAIGHVYSQKIVIQNAGKVPLTYSIPDFSSDVFSIEDKSGRLNTKESYEIEVLFKPLALEKYQAKVIIECKGVNYKEVNLVGVAGLFDVTLNPDSFDFGTRSCHVNYNDQFTLCNLGDLVLKPEFEIEYLRGTCKLTIGDPDSDLLPQNICKYPFTLVVYKTGTALIEVKVKFHEGTRSFKVKAFGTRIELSEKCQKLLSDEILYSTILMSPLVYEKKVDPTLLQVKKLLQKELPGPLITEIQVQDNSSSDSNTEYSVLEAKNEGNLLVEPIGVTLGRSVENLIGSQYADMAVNGSLHSLEGSKETVISTELLEEVFPGPLESQYHFLDSYIIDTILKGKVPSMDYPEISHLLSFKQPSTSQSLQILFNRPPAITPVTQNTSETSSNQRDYVKNSMTLDRKSRNAPATGIFERK